ncbi:hypothetical protein [Tianweitania sediminis]|uniref:Uncharacterized protein n=1 Tax=Tianweitania sediminis TaxID=1502156 RepID=A0A8J7UKI1_9HYPH|nr:hypothetical protein [Tianweitania sediminis]MBP0438397.1 hypothetical protein [Tianweitania sediminis]
MTLVQQTQFTAAGQGKPLLTRDPLLRDDYNRGVKWLFDLARPLCYGGASPVVNGAPVKNLAEAFTDASGAIPNGQFIVTAGQTLPFADGGVDFSGITANGVYLEGPSAAAAAIWANSQYYLGCLYVVLPSSADWETSSGIRAFISWTTNVNGYALAPDVFNFGQLTTGGQKMLFMYRQKALNSVDGKQIAVPATEFSQFAQIATWRNATEQRSRIRTANGMTWSTSTSPGTDNTVDFSTTKPLVGIHGIGSSTVSTTNAKKWKLHRGFVEALGLSGRDPVAVLDADWERTKAKYDAGFYS